MIKKKFFFILLFFLFFSCSNKKIVFENLPDISTEEIIINSFINIFTYDFSNFINFFSPTIKKNFINESEFNVPLISKNLIFYQNIYLLKNKLVKEKILINREQNNYFILFNDFKFSLSFTHNFFIINKIFYMGNDNFLNLVFNNNLISQLTSEEKEQVFINYLLTESFYFFELCKKLNISFIPDKILYYNYLLNSKNYYQFYFYLSLLFETHIYSLKLDDFIIELKKNTDKIYNKNLVNELINYYTTYKYYNLKDNILKLKLYHFYKLSNYELFNYFFEKIINNYYETPNFEFVYFLENELYKNKNLNIDIRRIITIIQTTKIIELKRELYLELFYHLLFFNSSLSDLDLAEKILKNIEKNFKNDYLFNFIELQIKLKKRSEKQIIASLRNFYLKLISTKGDERFKDLINAIIANQISYDNNIYFPYPNFNILQTIDKIYIIKNKEHTKFNDGDILIMLNNFQINDYLDFLIALNHSEINKKIKIKYIKNFKIIEEEIIVNNFN